MDKLLDFAPQVEDVAWHGDAVFSYGKQRHPIEKAPDGRLAVDVYMGREGPRALLWRREDHPNLPRLPDGTPRAIKRLYTAEGQMLVLRQECDYFGSIQKAAFDALEKWRANER